MDYKRNLRIGVDGYTDNETVLDVYGNINVSKNINVAGTITYDDVTNVDSIGIVTARTGINVLAGGINVTGVSTFTGAADFNSDVDIDGHTELDNLNVSGVSTLGTLKVSNDVNVVGVLTAERLYSNVFGEFTGGGISGTNIVGTSLSISGISTLGTLQISSGIVTATSGIITYYGDGSKLTGTTASKSVVKYVATDGQTSFAATYEIGYVDFYLNGVKLTDDLYDATSGSAVILNDGAAAGDIVEIIAFTFRNFNVGIQSGGSLVGSAKTINFGGSGISSVTVSSGIATINIEGSSSGINPIVANIVF